MNSVTRGKSTQTRKFSSIPFTKYENFTCDFVEKSLQKFDKNGKKHFYRIEEQFQLENRRLDIIVFEDEKPFVVIDAKFYQISRINSGQIQQLNDYKKITKAPFAIMIVNDKKITRHAENLAKELNIEILEFPFDSSKFFPENFIDDFHQILAKNPKTPKNIIEPEVQEKTPENIIEQEKTPENMIEPKKEKTPENVIEQEKTPKNVIEPKMEKTPENIIEPKKEKTPLNMIEQEKTPENVIEPKKEKTPENVIEPVKQVLCENCEGNQKIERKQMKTPEEEEEKAIIQIQKLDGSQEAKQINPNLSVKSKIDGPLDMRLKENRKHLDGLNIDGTPDLRLKVNQNIDGTPDLRLKVNQNIDGTADMRLKQNNSCESASKMSGPTHNNSKTITIANRTCESTSKMSGPTKKDGSLDMRFKENRRS